MVLTDSDLPKRHGSVMACCRAGGTECSSAGMGALEGGSHYLSVVISQCSICEPFLCGYNHILSAIHSSIITVFNVLY